MFSKGVSYYFVIKNCEKMFSLLEHINQEENHILGE